MNRSGYCQYSKFFVLLIACLSVGCANTGASYRPIIDSKNVDFNQYEADLRDCQNYARQSYGAGEGAMTGAAAGAALSALIAAAGGSRYDKAASAAQGAVLGAAAGAARGETDQRTIIRRCLNGRGYSVLQ